MDRSEIERRLMAATAAQQAGRHHHATRIYESIGDHPIALNARGVQALSDGDTASAARLFSKALVFDSSAPELWMNLAKAHRMQGDDSAELTALDSALAIDQTHFMAVVRKAELLDRTGATAKAAGLWSGVLTLAASAPVDQGPAFAQLIEHARNRVKQHRTHFATVVDEALEEARASISSSVRRRFDACVDHTLGRRAIYTNACAGLHFPFLPADEYFERHRFPWLAALEAETSVIRAELVTLLSANSAAVRPYVAMEPGTPVNKWSALDRSLDWGALHLWKDGRRDDAACALTPRTAAIMEALPLSDLPGRTPTVFFSLLRPGAHLPAHTGVSNVRTIIHLPLIVPPGCTFRVGGETRAWVEGEAWAFDDTIEHEAWNRSNETRAILIFDVWNPYLTQDERALLRRFYAVTDGLEGVAAPTISD